MADRIVAVVALAGALLIALAVAGVFSAPPSPALGASSEYCEYGVDQYGDCLPPPTDSTKPTIGAVQTPAQNANGWNNTNVTLNVTAADEPGGSGVASITCTVGTGPPSTVSGASRSLLFTATTFNQPVTCTATDNAGNVSNPVVRTVRIDKVPPSIMFQSQSPVPNAFGWNRTNVVLIWTCSDGFSGVTASAVSRTLVSEGADQSAMQTCNDRAGNTASDVHGGVDIDRTSPVLTFLGQSPLPNPLGWNNTDVTLTWSCSDALSGVDFSVFGGPVVTTLSQTVTFVGANLSATGSCVDRAGNFTLDNRGGVKIDRTPPTLTFQGQTPPPNGNASGTLLVLDSEPGDYIGGGTKQEYTSADSTIVGSLQRGGDYFSASVFQSGTGHSWAVNIAAPPGVPLAVGSYEGAVRAEFRGPGEPGLDVFGDGRGCNQVAGRFNVKQLEFTPGGDLLVFDATFEQHCESALAPALFGRIRIDNRNPGGTPVVVNGWNNTGVTLTWSCTDNLSGVAPSIIGNPVLTSLTATLTDEGAGQSATGTCIDNAGNTASDTRGGIAIDRTPPNPPLATADRGPEFAGGGGWFKDVVAVSFAANGDPDGANGTAGSGVDPGTIPPPVTFTDDGPHVAGGAVSDLAGNESAPGTLSVQVDAAAPVVSATFTTADGSAYVPGTWTNQAVTATFSCSDDGSGVASTSPPATVSTQGADQSVTGSCTDNVGHPASSTFSGIDVDLTPPEAVVSFDPGGGDVVVRFTDAGGSGVPAGAVSGVPVGGKGPAKDDRRFEQSDAAGNTVAVVLRVKATAHDVDASFETLSYDGRPPADVPDNALHFAFDLAKDGSVKRLSQDVRVGKGPSSVHVTADYDPKKEQTKIHVGGPGGDTIRPGLVLVTVSTDAGALVVGY